MEFESETDWAREPDRKFFLAYDFNAVDNWLYHDPEHYPIFGGEDFVLYNNINQSINMGHAFLILVEKHQRYFTPQVNRISLRMPSSPPLSQHHALSIHSLCNQSTVANCKEKQCACPYTLQIPLGSLIEVILIDEGTA